MRIIKFRKDLKRLYYYCKLSTALEFILPQKQLLLSPLAQTNDPRENKTFLFTFGSDEREDVGIFELSERYCKILRDDCKVLCFSQDYKKYRGCHLSKMWAQYGDNHKGICLELNMDKFIAENADKIDTNLFRKIHYSEFDFLRHSTQPHINYDELRRQGEVKYIREHLRNENINFFYFTKNDEWESEAEYRLLHFSDNPEKEYCSIKDSLELIHLGVDFHQSYIPAIKNLCSKQQILQLKFIHDGLVCTPIDQSNCS